MQGKHVGWTIGSIAAIGTLIGGVAAACGGGGGNTAAADGTGNNAGNVGDENAGCVVIGEGSCELTTPKPVDPDDSDASIEQKIYRDVAPEGEGPWPFTVLYDDGQGLFVRNIPERDGYRIGYARHAAVVWVDCVTTSDFDPNPSMGAGPTWYQVRWSNDERSDEAFRSEPSDPAKGFSFAGYLQPNGHNGDVPECSTSAAG